MSELPAAASTALRATLTSREPRGGRVLAAFSSAVYVALDDPPPGEPAVLALVTSDGVRLPNALAIAATAAARPFRAARAGQPALAGRGAVHLPGPRADRAAADPPGLRVGAARWWDPRPRLRADRSCLAPSVAALAEALRKAPSAVADRLSPLARALAADDHRQAAGAAESLLGLGPGLTPAGDDVLAGALATFALLVPAGPAGAWAGLDRVVAESAAGRTTALSAALLGCARRGQVAVPVADVLRALTGDGVVEVAVARLVGVGHSSGRDLAAGILLAARSVAARAMTEVVG